HIFLLDVVWDSALLDQVVSRAWRLGNKTPTIIVEQLVMGDTLEETMSKSGRFLEARARFGSLAVGPSSVLWPSSSPIDAGVGVGVGVGVGSPGDGGGGDDDDNRLLRFVRPGAAVVPAPET